MADDGEELHLLVHELLQSQCCIVVEVFVQQRGQANARKYRDSKQNAFERTRFPQARVVCTLTADGVCLQA